MSKDFYQILGVGKDASAEEIKKSYRKLAHKFHPDKGGGKDAEEKFKEINEAYQVLGDETKRANYDRFGSAGFGSGAGGGFNQQGYTGGFGQEGFRMDFDMGGDLGDIFDMFFGGQGRRGQKKKNTGADIVKQVEIDFLDAVHGADLDISFDRLVKCSVCDGTGAKDKELRDCIVCEGKGKVDQMQRTIFGSFRQAAICGECLGTGKVSKQPCNDCGGQGRVKKRETETVEVPAGVEDGMILKLSGKGEAAIKGGQSGDLIIKVRVKQDSYFVRKGNDIFTDNHISFPQAVLGDVINVKTVDGDYEFRIPAGTPGGEVIKITDKGVPYLGNKNKRGYHFVTVVVDIPKSLTNEEKEALINYASVRKEGFNEEGVFDKFKRKIGL